MVGLVLDNPLIERLSPIEMFKRAPAWVEEYLAGNKPRPKSEIIQKGLGVNFPITVRPEEFLNVIKFTGTLDEKETQKINLPTVLFYGVNDHLLDDKNKLEKFKAEIVSDDNLTIVEQNGSHSWGQQDLEKYYTSQVWAIEKLRDNWIKRAN